MIINTHGKWRKFTDFKSLEIGKTYKLTIDGNCEFALSQNAPDWGINTNIINYTHQEGIHLWIRTNGE